MPIKKPSSETERKLDEFYEQAKKIKRRYDEPENYQFSGPYTKPLSILKVESYKFIRRKLRDIENHSIIKRRAEEIGRDPSNLTFQRNQFHFGLIALDIDEKILDAKRISLWARQMTYAARHEIPAHLLIGFLYQSGSSTDISKKLMANYMEPWFGQP